MKHWRDLSSHNKKSRDVWLVKFCRAVLRDLAALVTHDGFCGPKKTSALQRKTEELLFAFESEGTGSLAHPWTKPGKVACMTVLNHQDWLQSPGRRMPARAESGLHLQGRGSWGLLAWQPTMATPSFHPLPSQPVLHPSFGPWSISLLKWRRVSLLPMLATKNLPNAQRVTFSGRVVGTAPRCFVLCTKRTLAGIYPVFHVSFCIMKSLIILRIHLIKVLF